MSENGTAVKSESVAPQGAARQEKPTPLARRRRLNERRAQIIRVFAELGFADLLSQTGLWQQAPPALRTRLAGSEASDPSDAPARLRLAFEELGGGFVKLGQTLSVRPDLIPDEYVAELQKLQDDTSSMSFGTVRQVVESELGRPLEDAFASVSETPSGSASISQVHRAELHDGTAAVVKVQRPEAQTLIDLDLELMTQAAVRLSASPWAVDWDVVGFVAEFAEAVRSELDFTSEARSLDRFREFFADSDDVVIPTPYWEYTSSRLLTESLLLGIPLSRPEDIRESGGDTSKLIRTGVNAYMRMVFELRRFHSDPHPGNLLALEGDRIGFVDFGRVSTVSERGLDRLADCLIGFARNDSAGLTDAVLDLTHADPEVDREALRGELEELLDRYGEADVAYVTSGPSVITETLEIVRTHRLRIPSQYAMLLQTLAVLQGVVLKLDPKTEFMELVQPYVEEVIRKRYSPDRISGMLLEQTRQYARIAARLPGGLDSVLHKLSTGRIGVDVKVDASDTALDRTEAVANRFSLTFLLSAMAIALALVAGQQMPEWMTLATRLLLLAVSLLSVWHIASVLAAERRARQRKRSGA